MPKTSHATKLIEVFAKGHAVKDPETLSISNLEEAQFLCQNDDVNVVFDFDEGSPFERECFHVYKGNSLASGPLKKKGVPIGGHYRYNIYPMKSPSPMGTDAEIIITP